MSETKYPKIVAGVVVFNSKGEILLAQTQKWKEVWVIVGGHLEWGESIEQCVIREVTEETNLEITDIQFVNVQESILSKEFHTPKHMVFLNYTAQAVTDDVMLSDELQNYQWIDPRVAVTSLPLPDTTKELIEYLIQNQ